MSHKMPEFRRECCSMLATIAAKIQERSPLKHLLARILASLDPWTVVLHPAEATKMFQKVLESLIELKWKTSEQADRVLAQYRKLFLMWNSIMRRSFCFIQSQRRHIGSFSV